MMSLPPLASPPAAAALRLQPRKPHQAAPPTPALRKGATPATAPLAPAKPPRREGAGAPAEPSGPFASSWPSTFLQRKEPRSRVAPPPQAAAAARGAATTAHAPALARGRSLVAPLGSGARSCESLSAAARGGRGEAALRFSLSLPPEAIRVLQRRSLEKQQHQQQQRRRGGPAPRSASPDAAKRPLAGSPAVGGDLRALLQVSLLNERHRYDDVEYEEEEEAGGEPGASTAREGLVRKCTEWLRGVESAAARDRADKLDTLPHLSTL